VLTTLELPPTTLLTLVAAAKETGAIVILNAAPSAAIGRELVNGIDVLIVNETEARDLLGHPVMTSAGVETALALRDLGPLAVVITLGAEGAVIALDGETTTLSAPAVEVRDTTGAGDAFCGAMAARLAAGDSVVNSAQAGVVAGSLATTRAGAQPSMPTRDEIARLNTR
jgi:ribokinase